MVLSPAQVKDWLATNNRLYCKRNEYPVQSNVRNFPCQAVTVHPAHHTNSARKVAPPVVDRLGPVHELRVGLQLQVLRAVAGELQRVHRGGAVITLPRGQRSGVRGQGHEPEGNLQSVDQTSAVITLRRDRNIHSPSVYYFPD